MNNEGADQTAHLRSLISDVVVRLLESTISKLALCKVSIFYLVYADRYTGFKLYLVGDPEDRFSRAAAYLSWTKCTVGCDSLLRCSIWRHDDISPDRYRQTVYTEDNMKLLGNVIILLNRKNKSPSKLLVCKPNIDKKPRLHANDTLTTNI